MLEITPTDLQRYRALVGTIDMPDAAKDEVILVVRSMMQDFVDRAFGDHPVQQGRSKTPIKASLESSESAKLAFSRNSEMKTSASATILSPEGHNGMCDGENRTTEGSDILPCQ